MSSLRTSVSILAVASAIGIAFWGRANPAFFGSRVCWLIFAAIFGSISFVDLKEGIVESPGFWMFSRKTNPRAYWIIAGFSLFAFAFVLLVALFDPRLAP